MNTYEGHAIADETRAFLTRAGRMLIGGEWVEAIGGESLGVTDPATGEEFARVQAGGAGDVDRHMVAIERRPEYLAPWPVRPLHEPILCNCQDVGIEDKGCGDLRRHGPQVNRVAARRKGARDDRAFLRKPLAKDALRGSLD